MDSQAVIFDQNSLRQRVLALMPAWRNREVGDFEFLAGGYANHNFRFRCDDESYVLRQPLADQSCFDRELEAAFYQQLNIPAGIATAPLIAFDSSTGEMISRWLEGALLIDVQPSPSELVNFVRQLHMDMPDGGRSYDPVALSREFLSHGTPDPDVARLAAQLRWNPAAQAPCHNDLNPWNVIVNPQAGWVTLDWEWFGNNDPIFDLVTLHQGLEYDDALLPSLAQALTSSEQIDKRVTDCLTAFWLREYAWAHAELTKGNDRAEIRLQRNTAAAHLRTR